MKLSLEHIRILLREKFGHESFIASFISSVEASNSIPTACINREGEMLYNPEFMEKHVKTREDMFCIIVHEMMHPSSREREGIQGSLSTDDQDLHRLKFPFPFCEICAICGL